MTRRFCQFAIVFGVLAVFAGCSSSPPATATTADCSTSCRLGAGDPVGWAIAANHRALLRTLHQTDDALAATSAVDR
jgi:hypothetical protein